MSEQKNGFGRMEFGTENSLEALFGSFSTPPYEKARKEKLLIFDEWLLYMLKEAEIRDMLELVENWNKMVSS